MKNQQKWLTDKIKGEWMDKDNLLEICLFESLVHFVEEEKGLSQGDLDWSEDIEKGFVTQAHVDSIKAREGILRHCYDYIKRDRPKIVEILDTIEDWKEYERIEQEIYDEDSEVMRNIIEQRGYLWS